MADVLVVEDDRVVLGAVAGLCRSEGLAVDECAGVAEAEARSSATAYRLAIVDVMLPERSGFELLRAVRARQTPLPTVMISGYATAEMAVEALRLGAFDFLPKPFDVPELLGVVGRALRWGERLAVGRGAEPETAGERRYFLGGHSWAALDSEGTATLGAAETFHRLLGEVAGIELPAVGDHLVQGQKLAALEAGDELHRIWAPLGGLVVAVNAELGGAAGLVDSAPFGGGWLVRIVPSDPGSELPALTLRAAGEHQTAEGG